MLYYKWYKQVRDNPTMLEVTKDYFADGDRYINEEHGWTKSEKDYIEVKEDEDGEEKR